MNDYNPTNNDKTITVKLLTPGTFNNAESLLSGFSTFL